MYYIFFIAVTVLFSSGVRAQEEHGDVVVHSDPRLGLLLKKERTVARAATEREHAKINADRPIARAVIPVSGTPTASTAVGIVHEKPAEVVPSKPLPRYVTPPHGKVIYSGKGFRVQIYNGPDRNKAMDIKMQFMRNNPALRTYLTYIAPCFRVKVGNYRHRSDAEGMYREARSTYQPCMIVPDIITINTY